MNLEQFLKPTIKKLVITILLSALLIFTPIIRDISCDKMIGGTCYTYYYSVFTHNYYFGITNPINHHTITLNQSQISIILIILSYLISCIITYYSDKFKKRN